MTIEEMKKKFIDGSLAKGIFTSGDNKLVTINNEGFTISTLQDNGWTRINIYEYDGEWTESEEYER